MRGKKGAWILIILLLAGATVGGLIGEALVKSTYFNWMSFGGVNGYRNLIAVSLNPLVDARVIRFGFDFALNINAGSILGMILGVLVYMRV